jgi:hypothetical protein
MNQGAARIGEFEPIAQSAWPGLPAELAWHLEQPGGHGRSQSKWLGLALAAHRYACLRKSSGAQRHLAQCATERFTGGDASACTQRLRALVGPAKIAWTVQRVLHAGDGVYQHNPRGCIELQFAARGQFAQQFDARLRALAAGALRVDHQSHGRAPGEGAAQHRRQRHRHRPGDCSGN